MKIGEALKKKKAEETFSAALVVVLFIILPMWGGTAMLAGSVIGLVLIPFYLESACAVAVGGRRLFPLPWPLR